MAKDFRASQVQTTQIISSGSSGTNAKIVVYPIESQDQSSLNQGIIDPTKFSSSSIGNDIFLYVSGGIGERDTANASISVFGGDLFVSGNLNVVGNLSVTGSGGGIGGNDSDWVNSGTQLYTTSSVSIDSGAGFAEDKGANVFFYVSGTRNSRTVPGDPNNFPTTLLDTDTYISGVVLTGENQTVISGNWSMLAGGQTNYVSKAFSAVIAGGKDNIIRESFAASIVGSSGSRINAGALSFIAAGIENDILTGPVGGAGTGKANYSAILGGTQNTISGTERAVIVAGNDNLIIESSTRDAAYSTIIGNQSSGITGSQATVIAAGFGNQIEESDWSGIVGGTSNRLDNVRQSFIAGGFDNAMKDLGGGRNNIGWGAIIGGESNRILGTFGFYNVINGGFSNVLREASRTFAAGGANNSVYRSNDSFILGRDNAITGSSFNFENYIIGDNNTITNNDRTMLFGFNLDAPNADNQILIGGGPSRSVTVTFSASNGLDAKVSTATFEGIDGTTTSLGADTFFFVSGTFGSGSAGDAVSVFGGDVRISGTLAVGTGSAFIQDDRITLTSASMRNVGGQLTFFDDDVLPGVTLSQLTGSANSLQDAYTGGNSINLDANTPIEITGSDGSVVAAFTNTPQFLVNSGSAASPGTSFVSDTDTGIYLKGADQLGFATAGSERWYINTNGDLIPGGTAIDIGSGGSSTSPTIVYSSRFLTVGSGTPSLAVYSFGAASDFDTGMYRPGEDIVGITAGAAEVARFANTASNPQVLANSGSAANPGYSFADREDSGFYHAGGGLLAWSSAGVTRMQLGTSTLLASVNIAPDPTLNHDLGTASRIWGAAWLVSAEGATTSGPSNTGYDLATVGTNAGAYAIGVDSSLLTNTSASATDLMTTLDQLDQRLTNVTGSASSYTEEFLVADWQVDGSNEVYTISGSTHALETSNLQIQMYESGSSGYSLVTTQETLVNSNFDVQFTVNSGSSFIGKAVLHKAGVSSFTTLSKETRLSLGSYTVSTATSSNPQAVGGGYFVPTEHNTTTCTLRAIVATTTGSNDAVVQLYNITSGAFVEIGGTGVTEISSSNTAPTNISSVNLFSATNFDPSSAAVYEVRVYGSGSASPITTFVNSELVCS